jgi:hypothetical protein
MAIPGAAGVESLGGDVASRLGGRSTGFTQFNLLSCQQDMKWFADRMVKVDEEGAQVRAAAAWLGRLGRHLVGGLGVHELDKEAPPPIARMEWSPSLHPSPHPPTPLFLSVSLSFPACPAPAPPFCSHSRPSALSPVLCPIAHFVAWRFDGGRAHTV